MPNDGALGDQAALVMAGFMGGADEGERSGVVPEPDADLRVGRELGGFHLSVLHTHSGLWGQCAGFVRWGLGPARGFAGALPLGAGEA